MPKASNTDTRVSIAGKPAPRLPHERDESSDSTSQTPRPESKQAYADVKRGLVDTDKGPVMNETYKRVKTGKRGAP